MQFNITENVHAVSLSFFLLYTDLNKSKISILPSFAGKDRTQETGTGKKREGGKETLIADSFVLTDVIIINENIPSLSLRLFIFCISIVSV